MTAPPPHRYFMDSKKVARSIHMACIYTNLAYVWHHQFRTLCENFYARSSKVMLPGYVKGPYLQRHFDKFVVLSKPKWTTEWLETQFVKRPPIALVRRVIICSNSGRYWATTKRAIGSNRQRSSAWPQYYFDQWERLSITGQYPAISSISWTNCRLLPLTARLQR